MKVVKVCGLRRLEDIEYCATIADGKKITHLGIICVPGRKRTIEKKVGCEIKGVLDRCTTQSTRPKLVGVFRNQFLEDITALAREYHLDTIQFHDDNPDWLKWSLELMGLQGESASSHPINPQYTIIKRWCFPRDREDILVAARTISDKNLQDYFIFLFDSENGGEGKVSNDWGEVDVFMQEVRNGEHISPQLRFIMAGGMKPENVQDLKKTCSKIDGMDVSSGVEDEVTGWKDHGKIDRYVQEAYK
ncbi:hypothetical protein ACO0QE_000245 [Hanseniaspora vineae]